MKRIVVFMGIAGVLLGAGPFLVWEDTFDSGGLDQGCGLALDGKGNLYVGGYASVGGDPNNYLVVKYDTAGDTLWHRFYYSDGDDMAGGIAADGEGNVIISGFSAQGGIQDFLTVKYSPEGEKLWHRPFDRAADRGYDVCTDQVGNIYVTGYCIDAGGSFLTVKYDPSGNVIWDKTYDDGNDNLAAGVAADDAGNVYVAGRSLEGGNFNVRVVKYNSQGSQVWAESFDLGADDFAGDICVDSDRKLYLACYSVSMAADMYKMLKLSPNGDSIMVSAYDPGGHAEARGIALDDSANTYLTGKTDNGFCTVKFSPLGDVLWSEYYGSTPGGYGVEVDNHGGVYVAGASGDDLCVIKYQEGAGGVLHQPAVRDRLSLKISTTPSGLLIFSYQLGSCNQGKLCIYDPAGAMVRRFEVGGSSITWDGLDYQGRKLPGGVYFARLAADNRYAVVKTVLLK